MQVLTCKVLVQFTLDVEVEYVLDPLLTLTDLRHPHEVYAFTIHPALFPLLLPLLFPLFLQGVLLEQLDALLLEDVVEFLPADSLVVMFKFGNVRHNIISIIR